MIPLSDRGYRDAAAGLFAVIWLALAIAPLYRQDWLLENLLVMLCAGLYLWQRNSIRISKLSVTLIFVYLCFHEIGAHYTYSKVPYDDWARTLTGGAISGWLGLERNHFDRLVHFLYGALLSYPMREVYVRRRWLHGRLTYTFPVAITLAFSATYEVFEWWAAALVGGDLGTAYLGTQGDIWDAQKDMALAGAGALLAMVATAAAFKIRRPGWDQEGED